MEMLESFKNDPDARQAAYRKLRRRIATSGVPVTVIRSEKIRFDDQILILACEFMTDPSFASMTIQDKQQNKKS